MKRVAIFAHYSSDSKIEDHVIYYLQGLNQVTDYIIFVSEFNIFNFFTFIRKRILKFHSSENRIYILGKWYYLK